MASIFKRGGATGGERRLLFNSFALMVIACTAFALCGEPKGDPKANPPEAPIRPGDTVKVATGPAPVKVGDKTLTTLEAGSELKAIEVQDAWVGVAVEKDGQKITGWINKKHLKSVAPPAPEKTPEDQPAKTLEPPQKPPARQLGIWEGFRGIAWGTNIKDIEGMELVEPGLAMKFYKRANDKLAIGEARLTQISYGFYKDRFACVLILCAGQMDFAALKRAVFATYGDGQRPNEFMEEWYWGGPFPGGVKDVAILLCYHAVARKGSLLLSYKPLGAERERHEEEAAKKAKQDF